MYVLNARSDVKLTEFIFQVHFPAKIGRTLLCFRKTTVVFIGIQNYNWNAGRCLPTPT